MSAKIEVRNLSKSFATDKGFRPVISNIDFTVADGEFVTVKGPDENVVVAKRDGLLLVNVDDGATKVRIWIDGRQGMDL